MIYQNTYTNLLDGMMRLKVLPPQNVLQKLLLDVVTVGHLNIFINEVGCLKMKNLVDFN